MRSVTSGPAQDGRAVDDQVSFPNADNDVHPKLFRRTARSTAKHNDTLWVELRGATGPARDAEFTQRHALAVATNAALPGGLLLVFELTNLLLPAKLGAVAAGLFTIYEKYRVPRSPAASVGDYPSGWIASRLQHTLCVATTEDLVLLGQDRTGLKRSDHKHVRSKLRLDPSQLIMRDDGECDPLERIAAGTRVFCPIHVDVEPAARVHRGPDGAVIVQCDVCRRTYTQPRSRSYNFDEFNEVVRALEPVHQRDRSVLLFRERYLPRLTSQRGASFIKSPKGSGKTEFLSDAVTQLKQDGKTILLIGHRRSLIQQTASRLSLVPYFEYDFAEPLVDDPRARLLSMSDELPAADGADDSREDGHYELNDPSDHFAVCLDSLGILEPKKHKYDAVIIDESEQVFAHLFGGTLRERRREIFLKFQHYIRQAETVVLLDADMGMVTVTVALTCLNEAAPVRVIINDPVKIVGGDAPGSASVGTLEFTSRSSRGEVVADLLRNVSEGKKCFVATNSRKRAGEVAKLLAEKFPSTRVTTVTSENSQEIKVQQLLRDIPRSFDSDLQVLIASPAIGTGIDITFYDRAGRPRIGVDAVFGIFEGNINTHFDIDQQLMRVRHPGSVYVWVDPRPLTYETDLCCIERELERSVRQTYSLTGFEDDGTPIFGDDGGLIAIWTQVQAATRASRNALAANFFALRNSNGWTAQRDDIDEESATVGNAGLIRGKVLRQADRTERLLIAEVIDKDQADDLLARERSARGITREEQDQLERFRIERFYDDILTPELIAFDNEGRTRQQIKQLQTLMSPTEVLALRDEDERSLPAFDRQAVSLQRDLLLSLFVASGLFDPSTNEWDLTHTVEKTSLTTFVLRTAVLRAQLDSVFSISLNQDFSTNPVSQLKAILGLVGLVLSPYDVNQSKGKKIRRYALDRLRYEALMPIVQQRLSRAGSRAEPAAQTGSQVNTLQRALTLSSQIGR